VALVPLIEYEDASPRVRAVYDAIRKARNTDYVNNFWKALANDPPTLERTWAATRDTMAAGALDPLVKELVYLAVSMTNDCEYCVHSHHAAATTKGMTPQMLAELVAVVALANSNNRLASGYRVDVDARYRT
jgi:AhpD family alkylhydroperoxidase